MHSWLPRQKPHADAARVEEEMGDLFFALANLARKMGVEPEAALRKANDKFQKRFTALESRVKNEGKHVRDLPLSQLESYWQDLKRDPQSKEGTKDTKTTK